MDIITYSKLRDILIVKRDRAEELLKKTLSAKPIRPETYEDEAVSSYASSYPPSDNNRHTENYSAPVEGSFFAEVVEGLSDKNSFKKILQRGCKGVRTLVRWHQATRNYINELKQV